MASIDKVSTGWRARWRTPDGQSRSKTFKRKIDAEHQLTSVQHSKLTGGYVDPSAGRVTFKKYAEAWQRIQVHRPTTAAQVETNLRRHVLPQLGERPLGSIRKTEIQALVKAMTDKLAPATVELVYRYVVAIFRAAVADKVIAENPCVAIKLPRIEQGRVVPLETDKVLGLIAAIEPRYRAAMVLAAGTGLRQGEVFGLTVDRVDFLRRSLTVDRQLVLAKGQGPVLAPPKTKASYRDVPLPQVVVDAVAAHLAAFPQGPNGLIFTNARGEPIRRARFSEIWRPAAQSAGLPEGSGMHALRHYYASLLIRHGESVKVVQARLGHASAAETLDTYSHLWPDAEDLTRAAVDSVLLPGYDTNVTREVGQRG
ncbi:MAG TPA: tyrosine-type recombinase/integrase [Acidimicrobiales bacterium]|nr:tyrosine-type recombinase/integrase [Acidimicrobiales bacterium]